MKAPALPVNSKVMAKGKTFCRQTEKQSCFLISNYGGIKILTSLDGASQHNYHDMGPLLQGNEYC